MPSILIGVKQKCSFCSGIAFARSRVADVDDLFTCIPCMETLHAANAASRNTGGKLGVGNLTNSHPAFKLLASDHKDKSSRKIARPTGFWCACCIHFKSLDQACTCQTCNAMVCRDSACTVTTSTDSALAKFECTCCWYDEWYSVVKDRTNSVNIRVRVVPGTNTSCCIDLSLV